MKKLFKLLVIICFFLPAMSCKKQLDDLVDTQPPDILADEQVYSDPNLMLALMANLYSRIPRYASLNSGSENFSIFDEAIWSGLNNNDLEARNNLQNYAFDRWTIWDYGFIRDLNVAIQRLTDQPTNDVMTVAQKTRFLAELRFLRAMDYFEMVKRMGGVPLITSPLLYNFSGDPRYLQNARAKESEVYDFIAAECDAIKENLGVDLNPRRANKYAALALKSRAMLYAGSIAKYNNLPGFTNTSTPGGEAGIPAVMANDYYDKSLKASQEIINSGAFALYNSNPNKGENFYEAITNKGSNREVILVQDFLKSGNLRHNFTFNNIARSIFQESGQGSSNLSPSLNLVEWFDYLDGSPGTLKGVGTGSNTAAGQTNWIFYDNISDIFANKDARLYGTIIYPGTAFAGKSVQMLAGVYVWNAATNKYDRTEGANINTVYAPDGGTLTGFDGPHRSTTFVSNTGFYLRKFVDNTSGASTSTIQSDTWWIYFRLGEIYMNAAEAAFELGQTAEALSRINTLRERAGFPPNSLSSLTITKIQNERSVELAFEGHRLWDQIRWRTADKTWDGSSTSATANAFALYPYRIVRPGHPLHGKFVFDRFRAPRLTAPRFFRPGNYYAQISTTVLNNNPKIVRNPFATN